MRIFVAVPMTGRSEDEITDSLWDSYKAIQKIFPDQKAITFECNRSGDYRTDCGSLWNFARSVAALAKSDLAYFCKDWQSAKDCQILHDICESYNIQRMEE